LCCPRKSWNGLDYLLIDVSGYPDLDFNIKHFESLRNFARVKKITAKPSQAVPLDDNGFDDLII